MKIDLEMAMVNPLDGGYMIGPNGKELTMRRVMYESLVSFRPAAGGQMGQQQDEGVDRKFATGKLGHRIAQSGEFCSMSIEEAKICKECIGVFWAPGIVFWAHTKIEEATEKEPKPDHKKSGGTKDELRGKDQST